MGCCHSRDKPKDELTLSLEEQLAKIQTSKIDTPRRNQRRMSQVENRLLNDLKENTTQISSISESEQQSGPHFEESKEESLGEKIIQDVYDLTNQTIDQTWQKMYDCTKQTTYLQIYMQQHPITKLNVTRCEWIVPCSPQKFVDFMRDIGTQIELDSKIDEFKAFDTNDEYQEYKIYLSYKGFLVVSARDFVYFKKIKQIDQQNNIWCDASQSIEDERYKEDQKIRCKILLCGNTVQPLSNIIQKEGFLSRFNMVQNPERYSIVKLYSYCDTKLNVPLSLSRSQTVNEMRTYIEKCAQRLSQ